ncbi:mucin-12-like [Trichogramma pretiosum]|uniref:mucin-12-like n=1 Tax=Trichogramma pretiosum TaxID=7493 RepID=UPI0006C9B463|nr:mucin-12-like [Trichogramma pretiosum]
MDPSKQTQSSTSGTCGSSSSSSVRHAFSEPDVVPRTNDRVTRRPRQAGQRIHQFARGSHTPVPTTNQAVVLDWVPDIQLDSYIATVGNIVRPAHVRYASLVQPNRVCLFVSDAQMAQTLHGRTVVVEGHTLLVQPLIQPLARVLATNVYPFIEDQTIRDHLSVHHGVQVRDVVHVGADSQLPEYGHVLGFARHLYVPPEQLPMIPARITGRQVDWPYLIYLGSEEQRCTSCQHVGHLARYCAMDQRCIGAYAGSTTDRRSSISSGSSANHIPSDEGPPSYTSTAAADASVASASVPIQPRGVPSSLGPSPGQTVLKSEPSTATNANVTSSPKRTMPIGDQSSHERTPGKKKKNSSPLAETLAVSSPKTPKVQDSPKRSKERKDDLSSLERTPSKKNQISQSSLTKALEMMLDSPNAYFYPKGVILPSLMSSHTTNPQSKQVKNTINPSPLADDPSAPQPGTSTDHSSCPFVAATVGSPASQSNIGADPSADPSPSTPSNAAAAAANPSTSEGTPKKSIVKLDTIDISLVQCPPSSGTRSLTRAAARCSPSGDAQPQSAESRPRPATPGIRRTIGRPRSIIHFDRRTSPAASRWTYREQGEQEEEDELPLTSIEQQSTSDTE